MPIDPALATALTKISTQLGALAEGQEHHGHELAEIKIQVRATNGRVTTLEAAEIVKIALEEEREKVSEFHQEEAAQVTLQRAHVQDKFIGASVALLAVVIGAVLADLQFF